MDRDQINELEHIHEKIDRLRIESKDSDDQLRVAVNSLTDSVRSLDKSIRGNGTPGLITRVSILEDRDNRIGMIAGAIATVIAAFISTAALFIK